MLGRCTKTTLTLIILLIITSTGIFASAYQMLLPISLILQNGIRWVYTSENPLVFEFADNGNDSYNNPGTGSGGPLPYLTFANPPHSGVSINWGRNDSSWIHSFSSAGTGSLTLKSNGNSGGRTLAFCNNNAANNQFTVSGLDWARGIVLEVKAKSIGDESSTVWPAGYNWGGNYSIGGIEYNFLNLGGNPAGAPSGSNNSGMVLAWRTNNPLNTYDDRVGVHLMGGPTELAGVNYSLGGNPNNAPEHIYKMVVRRSPLPWQQANNVVLVNVYVDGNRVIQNRTVTNYADNWGDGFVLGSRQINKSPRGDQYDWVKLYEAGALPIDNNRPSRPLGVSVTAASSGTNITWNAATDQSTEVIGYRIKRNGTYIGYSDSLSYADASGNTSNTYQIFAVDSVGNESLADTTAPSVPTNVQASVISTTSTSVTWTASTDDTGLAGYRVFRNGAEIAFTLTNSYIDTTVNAGETYSYRIAAKDWAGNSSAQSLPAAAVSMPSVSGYCSIDMGVTDVCSQLERVQFGDGDTIAVEVGGLECRQPLNAENNFIYFDIDDSFIFNGSISTVYLEVCYFDQTGSVTPQYDSTGGVYTNAGSIALGGTNKWRTATWTLTNCRFANSQNGGADFRLNVGTDSVKIDSVRISAVPFSNHPEVQKVFGTEEVYMGLSHPQVSDGDTIVTTIAGKECRKPAASGDNYFYFNVSDAFAYNGSSPTIYLKVDYYDSANGQIQPQYDATNGAYANATTITTEGTNTWKQAFWTLNNVKFANRQNGSSDFRLYVGTLRNVHISKVAVSKVPFGPPAPVISYPFGKVNTLSPTISWIGSTHSKYRAIVEEVGSAALGWDSGDVSSSASSAICGVLQPNKQYQARVRIADSSGWSDYSEPAEFTTPLSPCIQFTFPADVTALNDARPTIKWNLTTAQSIISQRIKIDSGSYINLSTSVRSYRTNSLATGLHTATLLVAETGGVTSEESVRFWINATPADTGTLYVYDLAFLKNHSSSNVAQRKLFYDTCHFLSTLQGIVNRKGPRLYFKFFSVDDTWLNLLRDPDNGWLRSKTIVNLSGTSGINTLLSVFGNDINGVVEYDPDVWATSNVASTIAGVEDLVAIRKDTSAGSFYYQYVMNGPQLPVIKSLVGMFTGSGTIPGTTRPSTGSKKCDAYIWAKINYLDNGKCNPLELAYWLDSYWLEKPYGIGTPEHVLFNHDYIVSKRGFVFDLSSWGDEKPIDDPGQPLGTDLATKKEILLSAYNATGGNKMIHVSGFTPWWFKYTSRAGGYHEPVPSEWEWAKIATSYNAFMDADATGYSDFVNASIFSQFPLPDRLIQNPKPTPAEMRRLGYLDAQNNVTANNYLYFYIGDYDSAAWLYRITPGYWSNSMRGQTPMGWAFNPNLIQRNAAAFDYFFRAKSDQDYLIAGDSGAGYINPPNLFTPRKPSGLPTGAAVWTAHCEPFYRQLDYSITGFLINGTCGALNPTSELIYRPFSGDGIMTQPAWMHAGSHLEQNMPVARQIGDLSGSTQEMANIVHQNGVLGAANFISYRTILKKPDAIKGVVDTLRSQNPSYNYQSVNPYVYFYLLRQSLGGNNFRRATYSFDTVPQWGRAGDQVTVQIGVRNDGWDTWLAEGSGRTVLAVSLSPNGDRSSAQIVPLPRDIQPGEGEVLTFQLTVPPAGVHKLMYQMRNGNSGWFEDAGDLPWRRDGFYSYAVVDDIEGIRSAPNGTFVSLPRMAVTAGTLQFKSRAYVETTDRTWGIRINTDEVLDIGEMITVRGEIQTNEAGERYILPHSIVR